MARFDLCVVGAGPSGYAAAMRAVDFGKKVLLIEKSQLGGAGVTNGALSSKTWWDLARNVDQLYKNRKRYNINAPEVNFNILKQEVENAVNERKEMLRDHLERLHSSDFNELVTFVQGEAFIVSPNEIQVTTDKGTETYVADYIVLATGSRPRKLPDIPIDEKIILTSDGISNLEDFPKSMVILGAGVIGCEFATIFSSIRKTKVHVIDKGDHILPFEDSDVVSVIEKNMEEHGVLIHRNSQMIRMDIVNGEVEYELEYTNGLKEVFHVEKALVSVGRIPNYEGMGLEELGVKMDNRGIIDDDTQTSIPNIYAVGDITADIALVNVGELEGRYAVERIFGIPARKLVYENISTIMFLNPEVAGVGLNQKQAEAKGIDYKLAVVDYSCIPRAISKRNTQGFVKMLVTNDDKMKVLGMRVVGNHASSAMQAVALLISMNAGIEELAECVHPHPSIPEGIQECVRLLMGTSTFKPNALNGKMAYKICADGTCRNVYG
ncbi:MAG: NAD(P)/FAD-dependent oxidoreductase [Cyclobacteriaceae bacterium]|nr:NAD(P)/FAD-dependent oxidoreductase [Cyclobacteriaceae bacterium]